MIELKDDFKIYWGKSPIAKLISGKDYLKPNIELVVDDMLEKKQVQNYIFLEKWIRIRLIQFSKA